MNIKNLYFALSAALAFGIAGCSSDDPANTGTTTVNPKDAVYMNVTVKLPTAAGTRAENDPTEENDKEEIGLTHENTVNSVMLVLADKNNNFIGYGETDVQTSNINSGTGIITTTHKITKSTLSAYYTANGENGVLKEGYNKIHVFVFCNPSNALRDEMNSIVAEDDEWYNKIGTVLESPEQSGTSNGAIWGSASDKVGFLMSSYQIAERSIPKNFSDWDNFSKIESPFHFSAKNFDGIEGKEINNSGSIQVERSMARFDFKDGSGTGKNTYTLTKDDDGNPLLQIQLTHMALVNMSKHFYYLRRTSTDGLATNMNLCGGDTYIVDTDADEKNTKSIISNKKYSEHFNFCLGHVNDNVWTIDPSARSQWYVSRISDVLDTSAPDDNSSWTGTDTYGDYKIWRYVTENTIPGETKMQTNGITTGVVFKGKMIIPDDAPESTLKQALKGELSKDGKLQGNSTDDPILYVYGEKNIFVTWNEVRAYAISLGDGAPMYKSVFGTPTDIVPVAYKAPSTAGGSDGVAAVYSNDENSPDYLWSQWQEKIKSATATDTEKDAALAAFKKAATGKNNTSDNNNKASFTLYQSSTDDTSTPGYYCYYYYWNRHNDNGLPATMGPMEFGVVRNHVYKLAVKSIKKLGHPRISDNDPDPVDPEDPDEEGDIYFDVSVEVRKWSVKVNNIDF